MSLAILVPVLRRPQRVRPLLESIEASTPEAKTYFIPDPDDEPEREAILAAGGNILVEIKAGYAEKVNAAVQLTDEPLLFIGADDLEFHPGWFEAAKRRIENGAQVVGVNDLIERRTQRKGHATHFLVTREYAETPTIDGEPGPLFQGYTHNFCDDELIATAKKRNAYAYAEDAHVRHEHPMAGGPDDDVYRKGRRAFRRDRMIHRSRMRLWA